MKNAKAVLDLIGVLIADYPLKVKKLLMRFGTATAFNPSEKKLVSKVMMAIERGNRKFHHALARLITEQVISKEEDSFADPLSAVAGAIGSIAGLFGNAQKRKIAKEQARSQTLSTLLAYKASKEQAMAAATAREQSHTHKLTLIKTAGFLVIAGLVGWLFIKQSKSNLLKNKKLIE